MAPLHVATLTVQRELPVYHLSSNLVSDDVKVEGSPQPQQKQEKQEKKTPPPFSSGLPPKAPRRGTDPVIKPVLKKKDPAPPPRAEDSSVAPLLKKDQGWYQQMFQNFTTTVEETFNTGGCGVCISWSLREEDSLSRSITHFAKQNYIEDILSDSSIGL